MSECRIKKQEILNCKTEKLQSSVVNDRHDWPTFATFDEMYVFLKVICRLLWTVP